MRALVAEDFEVLAETIGTGLDVPGAVFLFLTYYPQQVKGDSPVTCGLAVPPIIACVLVSPTISSTVTLPRFGPRALIATGMLLGGAAPPR
jgi:hypothetical protein